MSENPTRVKFENQSLQCTLTMEERERRGSELAFVAGEIDRLEEQKKSATESFKSQIGTVEGRHRAIASVIRQGYEYRDVRCRRTFDYIERTVTVVREDTGEQVDHRPMNLKELEEYEASAQKKLFPEDEQPAEGEAADEPTITSPDESEAACANCDHFESYHAQDGGGCNLPNCGCEKFEAQKESEAEV